MISARLGIRSLVRNPWRSGLTLGGIAVAVALMVWTLAFYEGWLQAMIRGATAIETAQVQIHSAGYVDRPAVHRSFPLDAAFLETVASVSGVVALSPRVVVHGLVGNERRSQVARIIGVDPRLESATTPVADGVVNGRWLEADGDDVHSPVDVVLGSGLARQLGAGLGDELVVFLEAADGSLGNDLMRVVGVVRTGAIAVDRSTAYVRLADARFLAALEGRVHEVVVRTSDAALARATAAQLADALGASAGAPNVEEMDPDAIVVRPWQVVRPGIDQMIGLFRRSYWFVYLIIYLVAAVGILNTQRMSALERRREFGVMMAIGMRPRRMFRVLLVETGLLGLGGALLGGLIGGLLSWRHASAGFDMTMLTDQASFSYMGVAFSDRLYFILDPALILQPILVMLAVAVLSGLWPALRAARIEPAPTITGRA